MLGSVLLQLGNGQPVAVPVCKGCVAMARHREEVTHHTLKWVLRSNRRVWWHSGVARGNLHAGGAAELGVGEVLFVVGPVEAAR